MTYRKKITKKNRGRLGKRKIKKKRVIIRNYDMYWIIIITIAALALYHYKKKEEHHS